MFRDPGLEHVRLPDGCGLDPSGPQRSDHLRSEHDTERKKEGIMKKEYNFSKGKRGAVVPQVGKTRITIYLDDGILERFKAQSQRTGKGYQTLINDALNSHLGLTAKPLTEEMVRRIVREELSVQN